MDTEQKDPHWKTQLVMLNTATKKLVELGAIDAFPQVPVPTGLLADLTTRIENQLVFLGIPTEIHQNVLQLLSSHAQSQLIKSDPAFMEKTLENFDKPADAIAQISVILHAKILRNLGVEVDQEELMEHSKEVVEFLGDIIDDICDAWGMDKEEHNPFNGA